MFCSHVLRCSSSLSSLLSSLLPGQINRFYRCEEIGEPEEDEKQADDDDVQMQYNDQHDDGQRQYEERLHDIADRWRQDEDGNLTEWNERGQLVRTHYGDGTTTEHLPAQRRFQRQDIEEQLGQICCK